MNFILCLLIAAYFCLLEVKCRSVQLDGDVHTVLEDGDDSKDVNHDPESSGRFSWKRLKPILRREVQRIRNGKDGDICLHITIKIKVCKTNRKIICKMK